MKSFTKSSCFSCEEMWKSDIGHFVGSDTRHAGISVDVGVNIGNSVSLVLVSTMMVASEVRKEVAGWYGTVKYLDVFGGPTGVANVETESVSSRLK